MTAAPIIKKQIPINRLYQKTLNYDIREEYLTHYMMFAGYLQTGKNRCEYTKKFYTKPQITIHKKDEGLNVDFIYCKQGDCSLIENCGRYALIDFGKDVGDIKEFLSENIKGKEIDLIILSHFHKDHMEAMFDVFKNYKVKNIVILKNCKFQKRGGGVNIIKNAIKFEKACNASCLTMLEIGNCLHDHEHKYKVGNAEIQILGPTKNLQNVNDNSIVALLTYQNHSYLFTGDISEKGEEQLMEWCKDNNISLDLDVLKVAHHGSGKSTNKEFLEFTKPKFANISFKKGNSYGHPNKETIDRLKSINATIRSATFENSLSSRISIKDGKIFCDYTGDDKYLS